MRNRIARAVLSVIVTVGLACPVATAKEDEAVDGKPKVEKENKEAKKEGARQNNPFTRFWIHTVGAPMARGMKDGMKKVHKGLKVGARKISNAFTGGSKEKDERNRLEKEKRKKKDGERD
jgi:hypothetical protein